MIERFAIAENTKLIHTRHINRKLKEWTKNIINTFQR